MRQLERHAGTWSGTNGFRLMPSDPLRDAPFRATVAPAASGNLTQIAYTWVHPDDGEQEGLLVLGAGSEPDAVAAFWGDSWHQSPEPRSLEGSVEDGVVTVGYAYGGDWRWQIALDVGVSDRLTLTMSNVIPASAATEAMPAGPYAAMRAELRRTD